MPQKIIPHDQEAHVHLRSLWWEYDNSSKQFILFCTKPVLHFNVTLTQSNKANSFVYKFLNVFSKIQQKLNYEDGKENVLIFN